MTVIVNVSRRDFLRTGLLAGGGMILGLHLPSLVKGQGPGKKGGPPAVHIHHKFIIIDADTDTPTIYTGSANLSANSTNHNDENLLEITGSPELARTYLAEFMRIYDHYRARALWNLAHPAAAKSVGSKIDKKPSAAAAKKIASAPLDSMSVAVAE